MATQHDSSGPDGGGWYPEAPPPPTRPHGFRWPRWRLFTWFILAFNILMLVWIISAIAAHASTCRGLTGNALTDCEASNVGLGIGAILLFVFWALGDVILGVLWLVTRPGTRTCAVCGNSVKRGMTRCPRCGFDFAQQLRDQSSTAGWAPPPPPTPTPDQSKAPPSPARSQPESQPESQSQSRWQGGGADWRRG